MSDEFNPTWSKDRRRELRKRLTVEETMLWDFLKNRQLLREKFRRQCGLGSYIVDFYCPRLHLVIEVDGNVHEETKEYDAERDAYLQGMGCRVIHFSAYEIREHIQKVLERIRSEIASSSF
jgi:very-short-patch-repair endonuclease